MLISDPIVADTHMAQVLLVGVGGFVGSIARYLVVSLAQSAWAGSLPVGTLMVNVAGCFAVGWLSELFETQPFFNSQVRSFLVIGLLGSFTTFSAFGHETFTLLRHGGAAMAGANIAANVLLTIGGVWLGRIAAQLAG